MHFSRIKIAIIFTFLFLFLSSTGIGQEEADQPDEAMDMFLMSILAIFACVLIGAAILGAIAGSLVICFVMGLMGLGLLSTTIAIGFYKRSAAAGFKTFLMVIGGFSCAVIGCSGLIIINGLLDWSYSNSLLLTIGLIAGGTGGLIMGQISFRVLQCLGRYAATKLRLPKA